MRSIDNIRVEPVGGVPPKSSESAYPSDNSSSSRNSQRYSSEDFDYDAESQTRPCLSGPRTQRGGVATAIHNQFRFFPDLVRWTFATVFRLYETCVASAQPVLSFIAEPVRWFLLGFMCLLIALLLLFGAVLFIKVVVLWAIRMWKKTD